MKVGDLVYHKACLAEKNTRLIGYVVVSHPSSCGQHYKVIWLDGTSSTWYSKEEVGRMDTSKGDQNV